MQRAHSVLSITSRRGLVDACGLRIERLESREQTRMVDHFQHLSDEDRRLRFGRCMTSDALESYVAALDPKTSTTFVAETAQGALVAVVQAFAYEVGGKGRLEIAFSTHPKWRRLGLAKRLFRAVCAYAWRRGIARIVAQCDARNIAMRALLHGTDAAIEVGADEVSACWLNRPCRVKSAERPLQPFVHAVRVSGEQTASAPASTRCTFLTVWPAKRRALTTVSVTDALATIPQAASTVASKQISCLAAC